MKCTTTTTLINIPGLFCAEPNSPPVLVVVPNADVPKPPVVPKPASVRTKSSHEERAILCKISLALVTQNTC